MKQTIIRMGQDVILLLLPLMAFIGFVCGASVPGAPMWIGVLFSVAGFLVGLVFVAVFEKAVK